MQGRIYYVLSNQKIKLDQKKMEEKIKDSKLSVNTNIEDIKIMFNNDMLNVLSEDKYEEVIKYKYMYAFLIKPKNYLQNIKKLFQIIIEYFDDVEVILDAGSMRYINKEELIYYSENILIMDKLFTIEVMSSEYNTTYKTKGLNSIGYEEVKVSAPHYYNKNDLIIFKKYIINTLIDKSQELLMIREECMVIDYAELKSLNLIENNIYQVIYRKHLVDNYKYFYLLFSLYNKNKNFSFAFNNQKVEELVDPSKINYLNFSNYISSYIVLYDEVEYNCINIFYLCRYINR